MAQGNVAMSPYGHTTEVTQIGESAKMKNAATSAMNAILATALVATLGAIPSLGATDQRLTEHDMSLIVAGAEDNRDCGVVNDCVAASLCTGASPASCLHKEDRVVVPGANVKACNKTDGTKKCTETTPNIDCSYTYACTLNSNNVCVTTTTSTYNGRAPTDCKAELKNP